ncbi:MAG: ATP-binding cassette domain-containing protein [Anaerolineae bacterium]|jgi:ATP-binding cassette subfamily F protein 3|nr:ATP-binding cassette domain-containing protein [Anaerolineae bacterium]
MYLLQVHHLTVNLAGHEVFRDLNWAITVRDRIGLVGINGAGKSTLLKVIAGLIEADRGQISRVSPCEIGYLPQEITLASDTLYKAAIEPSPDLEAALQVLTEVETRLDDPAVYNDLEALEAALADQERALIRCERLDQQRHESLVREYLMRLGFTPDDYDLPTDALSGGQKKLVALARLAAWSPELLLLDEPDNHLDLSSKAYLEQFIHHYPGTVVIVSHDRYLLDEVVTGIAEIEDGQLRVYKGNYTAYTNQRELRRLRQAQLYEVQQREITRLETMIHEWELKAKADLNERHARQAASRRKLLARLESESVERVRERQHMELEIVGGRGSTKAVELVDVGMGFGDEWLFIGLNLLVQHGERVGLIGANGAGKSVIFKLIRGEYQPLEGLIKIGPSTRIGYYAQQHETLAQWGQRTPIDLVRDVQAMPEGNAVNVLLKFAFSYEQTRQPIATMSGGERSRLQLLRLMLQKPNLLLLDEPTNNLDIGSSEVLEAALDEFEGAVLVISHDRYFLDRVVSRIVELENGELQDYSGGYADYVEQKRTRQARRKQRT